MLARQLNRPSNSILLLGPRGTGKSTWIQQNFSEAIRYDLLNTREALRLSRDPGLLYQELQDLKKGSWVVLDEVQKVPSLLDEVHRLIEGRGLRFVLSGSSARKLKKGSVNLLAGRAALTHFFPFVSPEVNFAIKIPQVFSFGMLPLAYLTENPKKYLKSYADTYLQEEIKAEALTRNIGGFARFLEVAARQNGQITNVSNIARDAQVARQTVQGYFDILQDTLIGFWLPAWKLKRATKQVAHPKFYFFDSGVARALSERLPYPPTPEELGPLFETFVLGEIRAYLSYRRLDYPLHYWRSQAGVEVDIFCETISGFFALEIKSNPRWEKKFNRGLERLSEESSLKKVRCYGVYLGERALKIGQIKILPLISFLKELWSGELI